MPAQQCFESIANGIVFAEWPIMWIVVNAMYVIFANISARGAHRRRFRFVYNIAVRSGAFDLFRRWMIANTPNDQRIILLIIGYSFGALLEGMRDALFQD